MVGNTTKAFALFYKDIHRPSWLAFSSGGAHDDQLANSLTVHEVADAASRDVCVLVMFVSSELKSDFVRHGSERHIPTIKEFKGVPASAKLSRIDPLRSAISLARVFTSRILNIDSLIQIRASNHSLPRACP
jgi:hypothetical protein